MLRFLVIGIFVASAGYAQQVQNLEAEGNLEALGPLSCVTAEEVRHEATPADIARGMADCLSQENAKDAFDLFILFISRGNFDAKRVADRSAGQAVTVLLHQVGAEVGTAMQLMQPHQEAYLAEVSPTRAALCTLQRNSGAPAYHPRYMIQHGIKAFTGIEGDGQVPEFDADVEWERTLLGVAQCDRP